MFRIKRTEVRTPRPVETIIPRLTSIALLMLLASGLSSCGQKKRVASNSASGADSPQASPAVAILSPSMSGATPAPSPDRKVFKTGEAVPAGYLGYKVYSSWFTDHLATQDSRKKSPAAHYLVVDLSVVNTDRKERPVGPFKLIDEAGKEYATMAQALAPELNAARIGNLAPSASKRVSAIFEVPGGHQYRLKILGFSTADAVLIELSPAAAPPAK